MHFGFSYVGLAFILMLMIPNLVWTKNQPKDYENYAKNENKVLGLFERIGEALVTGLLLIFSDFNFHGFTWWSLWLLASFILMILYEIYWIRYFKSEKTMKDFYRSILGIPVAGATLPVLASGMIAVYGKNPFLGVATIILGIGHIHIHLGHKKEAQIADALNLAGVPVVTTKGKGGGIQLAEKYTLDKAILTEDEKQEILSSVQALQTLSVGAGSTASLGAISKLKAITSANADWIKVDFATWNPEQNEIKETFKNLKWAILNRRQVSFEYFSGSSENSLRHVDPWKIIFRGQAWYLYSFCKTRNAPRYFKLSRIRNFQILKDEISVEEKDFPEEENKGDYGGDRITNFIQLKVRVADSEVYRILDEYKVDSIEETDDKTKILTLDVPDIYWIKSWILSFGSSMQVLEPEKLRLEINAEIKKMHKGMEHRGL